MKAISRKGFCITSKGVSCIPCRCTRQSYHKETKTVKKNNIITTNIVEDRHNMKFGATGRHVSPDENGIFRNDNQIGSIEICDTGFGTHGITPEECENRNDRDRH